MVRMRILFLALGVSLVAACGDSASSNNPFFEDRVLNIAHRGANFVAPEETIEAYIAAKENGADVLEMDIQRTRDGVLILMHDATVDRTTNGTGAVADLTLEEIQELDAGYRFTRDDGATYPFRGKGLRVPTLQEMFERFPDDVMVIEIKGSDPSVSVDYAEMIRAYGRERTVITASFDEAVLVEFRRNAEGALTSMAQDEVIAFFALTPEAEAEYTPPGEFLHVPPTFSGIEVMNETFAARAARFGLPIHVFGTGNDPEVMQRMIDLGALGLMVDDILLAEAVIRANE